MAHDLEGQNCSCIGARPAPGFRTWAAPLWIIFFAAVALAPAIARAQTTCGDGTCDPGETSCSCPTGSGGDCDLATDGASGDGCCSFDVEDCDTEPVDCACPGAGVCDNMVTPAVCDNCGDMA